MKDDRSATEDRSSYSAELPVELLSKQFHQLATFGIARAGLAITLVGSVLRDGYIFAVMAAVEFGLAALVAAMGQSHLIEDLFENREFRKRSKILTKTAIVLISMAVGTLTASVVMFGRVHQLSSGITG